MLGRPLEDSWPVSGVAPSCSSGHAFFSPPFLSLSLVSSNPPTDSARYALSLSLEKSFQLRRFGNNVSLAFISRVNPPGLQTSAPSHSVALVSLLERAFTNHVHPCQPATCPGDLAWELQWTKEWTKVIRAGGRDLEQAHVGTGTPAGWRRWTERDCSSDASRSELPIQLASL